jgi:Adenosyl cobinamide kinase/adenosyl cobinamide phosphate guanylyltransferase
MIVLITGASSSGKSLTAETITTELRTCGDLYYIATMRPYDDEAKARVKRHQEMRAEKGFTTIEKYVDIRSIEITPDSTCLIECMSNLLANEMYDEDGCKTLSDKKIVDDILYLRDVKQAKNVVIVSNEVFSDGTLYDEWCTDYIDNLGKINVALGLAADTVIESVVGIPIYHKGGAV